MSNYNEIRALEAILYSEASAGYLHDLSLLAHALVAHYEFDLNNEQIDWIVNGVEAELDSDRDDAWVELLDPEVTIH
jgi:hypothetical protein